MFKKSFVYAIIGLTCVWGKEGGKMERKEHVEEREKEESKQ